MAGACYPEGMEFPREIVKRCVSVPDGREVPALPAGYRLEGRGMLHDDKSKTTLLRFFAEVDGYPVESYEARAAWQALVVYGSRVVQLRSELDHTQLEVYVTVAW